MGEQRPLTRKEIRRRRRRRQQILKMILLAIVAAALVVVLVVVIGKIRGVTKGENKTTVTEVAQDTKDTETETPGSAASDAAQATESVNVGEAVLPGSREDIIAQAEAKAVQYDYQGAIDLLNTIPGAADDADIIMKIADYETIKTTLVATSTDKITHVFFHSLVVDPDRGFSLKGETAWDNATVGFCEWMTTLDEFNAMMQQMYDRGYVLVSLYDIVDITTDESGYEHVTPKDVYLPAGKTPFVMSLDDLSYYHSYNGRGTATKLIIGEDGTPTCEYVDANGNTLVGSYDCVPALDDFIDAHPDFSYKGAKGTIALTGYNGILGYRTDGVYRDRVDLDADQQAYLDANPAFNWDQEVAQATAVANCIKEDGWTFASHTWGHIRIGDADLSWIQTDTEKWLTYVAPLVGGTDIIIFAHGQDLASWNEQYDQTEKFQYLKSKGFTIYCNVDSNQYSTSWGDGYLRQGRRNLDGYRLWMAVYGGQDKLSDLFDASSVFDIKRPTDASLYQL